MLKMSEIYTPLGNMITVSDEKSLYFLEFADQHNLQLGMEKLKKQMKADIIRGLSDPIIYIKAELGAYFDGTLKQFKTPLHFIGSSFQKLAWQELVNISYGTTRSYADQAKAIGKPKAYRAVANANGANKIAVVIPCHRIINSNGNMGGYAAGVERKKWLLNHEKECS